MHDSWGAAATRSPSELGVTEPAWPGLAALACAVGAAGALLAPSGSVAWHGAAYAVAAAVVPGFYAVHRHFEMVRQRDVWYRPRPWRPRVVVLAVTLGLVVAGVHGWLLATELAKR